YVATIVLLAVHHEVWRDEVRALSLAVESRFPWNLVQALHNDGHPALWHAILWLGFRLTRSLLVLQGSSIAIAATGVLLLAANSPFRWWQKLLFPFGLFPIYHFSVMCRNYGLSMLLLFAFCTLYEKRFERPFWVALILALLANANV